MKMKKTAGLSAILFLCLAMPVRAEDWVKICKNDGGEFYLNRHSVEDHGSYVTGWVRLELSGVVKEMFRLQGYNISYFLELVVASKGSRQIMQSQSIWCDRNGKAIYSDNSAGQWSYCTPNSPEEMVWYALMVAAGVRF